MVAEGQNKRDRDEDDHENSSDVVKDTPPAKRIA
jgi:hypothetical protein